MREASMVTNARERPFPAPHPHDFRFGFAPFRHPERSIEPDA